jgi:hypothetical protein
LLATHKQATEIAPARRIPKAITTSNPKKDKVKMEIENRKLRRPRRCVVGS